MTQNMQFFTEADIIVGREKNVQNDQIDDNGFIVVQHYKNKKDQIKTQSILNFWKK